MIDILCKDDLKRFKKVFSKLILKNNIYFGCYSLLSSLYIFNAKNILFHYEKILLKNFNKPKKEIGYSSKVDEKFSLLAKLNIKFYLKKESVSPVDVLVLQKKYKKALKIQKYFDIKENKNLKQLVQANTDKILVENEKIIKKPLTKLQKCLLACFSFVCICCLSVISFLTVNFVNIQSNLIYTYNDALSGYTVSCGLFYNPSKITLPSLYNNSPIVEIDGKLFKDNLTEITIPSTVKNIKRDSFTNCYNLLNIKFICTQLDIDNIKLDVLSKNKNIQVSCFYCANLYLENVLIKTLLIEYNKDFKVELASKQAYEFIGWFDSEEQNSNQITNQYGESIKAFNKKGNVNLYAKFQPIEYSIHVDFNSGEETYYQNSYNIESDKIVIENPTREGYVFSGWSGNILDSNTFSLEINKGTYGNLNFIANWTPNLNTITFDGNGATSGEMPNQHAYSDSKVKLNLNKYQKEGYSFAGWSSNSNGSIEYQNKDFYSMGLKNSYTLYAIWTPNLNSVIFNGNGSTFGYMSIQQGYSDSVVTLSKNLYLKEGYSFAGWSSKINGPVEYLDNAIFNVGTNSMYMLYAIWTPNLNTIIFDGNGATSGEMPNQQIKTNASENLSANTYSKEGYLFKGWSTSPSGQVEYANQVAYLMGTNSTYILYAVWTPNLNTIIFDGNGATSGEMPNQQAYSDSEVQLNANKYQKEGYTFVGWSLTKNGNVNFFDNEVFKVEIKNIYTLYAVWVTGNIYFINTEKEFSALTTIDYNSFDEIRLMNDLNFENSEIANFSYFTTIFNGNRFKIANFKLTDKNGLFDKISNAKIKNLGIENVYVTLTNIYSCLSDSFGGLVGHASNSQIENCYTTGVIDVNRCNYTQTDTRVYVGGIVGKFDSYTNNSVKNCYSECNITAKANLIADAGGILGSFTAGSAVTINLENCYATGNILTYAYVQHYDSRANSSGLIGDVNSYSSASGKATINVLNCFATGNLESYAGRYYNNYSAVNISNVTTNIKNCYAESSQQYTHNGVASYYDDDRYSSSKTKEELLLFVLESWDSGIWIFSNDDYPKLNIHQGNV